MFLFFFYIFSQSFLKAWKWHVCSFSLSIFREFQGGRIPLADHLRYCWSRADTIVPGLPHACGAKQWIGSGSPVEVRCRRGHSMGTTMVNKLHKWGNIPRNYGSISCISGTAPPCGLAAGFWLCWAGLVKKKPIAVLQPVRGGVSLATTDVLWLVFNEI